MESLNLSRKKAGSLGFDDKPVRSKYYIFRKAKSGEASEKFYT
jgi:hypothetical protein